MEAQARAARTAGQQTLGGVAAAGAALVLG